MLPASLGPASKRIHQDHWMSPVANSIKQAVLNSHDKAKIQRKTEMFFCFVFFKKMKERKNWFLQRQFISEEKFQSFAFMFHFFSFPPSLFLCLLSKTTWANIASCHIKAIPCILQRGEFCSWMEQQSSQTPNPSFTHMRCKDWGEKKPFFYLNQSLCPEDKPIIAQWRKFSMQ